MESWLLGSIVRESLLCVFAIQRILVVGNHKKEIAIVCVYFEGILTVEIHDSSIPIVWVHNM